MKTVVSVVSSHLIEAKAEGGSFVVGVRRRLVLLLLVAFWPSKEDEPA